MKWKPTPAASSRDSEDETFQHSFPAFAPTVSDEFDHLKGLPTEKTVPSGTVLVEQGLHPTSVFLLSQGLVKLTSVSAQGRESVIGLRSSGWYVGAVSALAHRPNVYSVKAITECVVTRLTAEEFSLWLMRSARMARHFTQTLCNELMSQSSEAQLRGGSAEERLDQFMRERTTRHTNLKTLDPLPMLKQMELAQLLAITPEHLSRLLRRSVVPAHALSHGASPAD